MIVACKNKLLPWAGAIVSLGLAASIAQADTVHYQVDGVNVTANSSDASGLAIGWESLLPPSVNFSLEDGESSTPFALFDIWTTESSLEADDLSARPISAQIHFSLPEVLDPTVGGDAGGLTVDFGGTIELGAVKWDGPVTVTYGTAGEFTIALSNAFWTIGDSGTVKATVTQVSSSSTDLVTSAPTPGAAVGGLVMMGTLATMRRRSASSLDAA